MQQKELCSCEKIAALSETLLQFPFDIGIVNFLIIVLLFSNYASSWATRKAKVVFVNI